MGLLIKVDGTEKQVDPENGEKYDLKELQTLVGRNFLGLSYIDAVSLKDSKFMIVDGNGELKGQSINERASNLVKTLIVGNVMVISGKEFGVDFDEEPI